MEFIKIDIDTWNRKQHYEFFKNSADCSINVTENIDITNLITFSKNNNIDFYPIYLYMVSKTINSIKEMRMTLRGDTIGYYSHSHPSYTVYNKKEDNFFRLVTNYNEDFWLFLDNYKRDNALYKDSVDFMPQTTVQDNIINISTVPWVNFSSLTINLKDDDLLEPLIINGKFLKENEAYIMPLSLRVNHRVADGYHVGLFFNEFKQNVAKINEWSK